MSVVTQNIISTNGNHVHVGGKNFIFVAADHDILDERTHTDNNKVIMVDSGRRFSVGYNFDHHMASITETCAAELILKHREETLRMHETNQKFEINTHRRFDLDALISSAMIAGIIGNDWNSEENLPFVQELVSFASNSDSFIIPREYNFQNFLNYYMNRVKDGSIDEEDNFVMYEDLKKGEKKRGENNKLAHCVKFILDIVELAKTVDYRKMPSGMRRLDYFLEQVENGNFKNYKLRNLIARGRENFEYYKHNASEECDDFFRNIYSLAEVNKRIDMHPEQLNELRQKGNITNVSDEEVYIDGYPNSHDTIETAKGRVVIDTGYRNISPVGQSYINEEAKRQGNSICIFTKYFNKSSIREVDETSDIRQSCTFVVNALKDNIHFQELENYLGITEMLESIYNLQEQGYEIDILKLIDSMHTNHLNESCFKIVANNGEMFWDVKSFAEHIESFYEIIKDREVQRELSDVSPDELYLLATSASTPNTRLPLVVKKLKSVMGLIDEKLQEKQETSSLGDED